MLELLIAGGICGTILLISALIIFGILLYDGKIVVPLTSGAKVKRARDEARVAQALVEKQRIQLISERINSARHELAMGRGDEGELKALEARIGEVSV